MLLSDQAIVGPLDASGVEPGDAGAARTLGFFAVRLFLIIALLLLFFSGLGTCAEHSDTPVPVHRDLIIVRRFATPRRIVTLDPSLGFSLHRGRSGVPPPRRAASVARATAFIIADAVTQQLRDMGYRI